MVSRWNSIVLVEGPIGVPIQSLSRRNVDIPRDLDPRTRPLLPKYLLRPSRATHHRQMPLLYIRHTVRFGSSAVLISGSLVCRLVPQSSLVSGKLPFLILMPAEVEF